MWFTKLEPYMEHIIAFNKKKKKNKQINNNKFWAANTMS